MRRFVLPILALLVAGAAGAGAPRLLRSMSEGVATVNIYVDGGLPDPGVSTGPTWAYKLNNFLLAVDAHDHTTGKGHTVPVAGLNINADLDVQSHSEVNVSSITLLPSGTTPGDTNVLFASGGDLRWADNDTNVVPITSNGVLALRTIEGNYQTDVAVPSLAYSTTLAEYSHTTNGTTLAGSKFSRLKVGVLAVSSNYTITDTDQAAVLLVDSTVPRTITLPGVTNSAGRLLLVKDKTGNAGASNITVNRSGGALVDGAAGKIITTNYGVLRLVSDGTNWFTL